jgi:hypothetical protein
MRFRVPKLLFNIAHFPKLNGADLTAIELCPFLEQAAGVACLIAGAVRHRPCCAVLIKAGHPAGQSYRRSGPRSGTWATEMNEAAN